MMKKTDYNIVKEDIKFINSNQHKLKHINYVNLNRIENLNIGRKTPMVDSDNYKGVYDEIIGNNSFEILFKDSSFITFQYSFNKRKSFAKYSLHYFPNCYINETLSIKEIGKYLRIDFEPNSHRPNIHSSVHIHPNIFRQEIRLSFSTHVYPKDFLYIIMKYFLCDESDEIELLFDTRKRTTTLLKEELNRLNIRFGNLG